MSGYMIWGLVLLAIVVAGLVLHFRYPVGSRGRRSVYEWQQEAQHDDQGDGGRPRDVLPTGTVV